VGPKLALSRRLARLVPVIALSGCSGIATLNALQPKGGITIDRNVAYEVGAGHTLDIYQPRGLTRPAPVVVFFYGGGWDSGDKAEYEFVGASLARAGFVTVIPNYRVFPQVIWPAFLQDNAAAVAWTRAHIAGHGGEPQDMFLMGHSAGAYDAVMLAVDRRWLAAVGMDPRRDLRGVVGLAGPYDFLPLRSAELKTIFGPQAQRPDTQPINHVDGSNPPMFLATDSADKVVDPGNTTRMADKVRAAGGPVDVRVYKGLSHALLAGALGAPLRFLAPVFADSVAFLRANDRGPAR
jgi:acetyl esterase/lipase